ESVEHGVQALSSSTDVVALSRQAFVDADAKRGSFVPPTLLRAKDADSALIHELEIFGPVATVVPYTKVEKAFGLAHRAGGALAASVFSEDPEFLSHAAAELGSSHGRVLLVDPSIGDSHTGHGIVLPSCMHGGPGRAGGGEELGGLHGLWFYHQRLAVQGSGATLAILGKGAADAATS